MTSLCINKIGGLGHVPPALTHSLSREVFSFTSLLPEHTKKKTLSVLVQSFDQQSSQSIQSMNSVQQYNPSTQSITPIRNNLIKSMGLTLWDTFYLRDN